MRGEYTRCPLYTCPRPELPPRARRIQIVDELAGAAVGTTSACAENTLRNDYMNLEQRNYLRVRGEYKQPDHCSKAALELPPRARRIRFASEIVCKLLGTTSACAENTFPSRWLPEFAWNYLRVRGEYACPLDGFSTTAELPPRARRIP